MSENQNSPSGVRGKSKHNIIVPVKDSDEFFIVNPLHKSADFISADEIALLEKELDELKKAMDQEGADLETLQKQAADLVQQLEEFNKKQAEWNQEQAEEIEKNQKYLDEQLKKVNDAKKENNKSSNMMWLLGAGLIGYALITRKKK